MVGNNRLNGHFKTQNSQRSFHDFSGEIEHNIRNQGYAWSSYLRSWQLMLGWDEIICLSGLYNIWSLAFAKPATDSKKERRLYKQKRRNFILKDLPIWEFDGESGLQLVVYESAKLPFFWCAINRLREECNFTKWQEDHILRKLKRKGIVRWTMMDKPFPKRFLHINTIQLDHYLRYVHSMLDRDESPEPGKKYIDWDAQIK